MKILMDNLDEFFGENARLVMNLMKRERKDEYPEKMKWSLQMLYFDKEWIEICRIDNHLHEGQTGSHIHILNREQVKRAELTFDKAQELIKEISKRVIKDKFKKTINFGDKK